MTQQPRSILNRVIEAGYQLSPDAFELLQTLSEVEADTLVGRAILKANTSSEPLLVLNGDFLKSLSKDTPQQRHIEAIRRRRPLAGTVEAKWEVLGAEEPVPSGDVGGFIQYFRSRFDRVSSILKRRIDTQDAVSIEAALKLPLKSKLKVVGLVTQKRARGGRLFIELEDMEHSVTVMASDQETVRRGLQILLDQVIAVDALKYRDDLLISKEFIWPDVPSHTPRRSGEPISAALLADLHVGSKYFRADLFDRFIEWMNRDRGTPQARELASTVKYVVIAGDLVDGIGIYPGQEEELEVMDLKEQYEEAARLLARLPDYLEIIVIPGNHDACRKSLPQPPIPEEYAKALYADPRVHMLPNPSLLSLNGVHVQVAHGKGLDDILSSTPGHNFHRPVNALELLLRCRLVAPIYGQTTPIAPERNDRLVIKTEPDVFLVGHVHINQTKKYKGVTLISSGAFQDQTPFQSRMNLKPTPGVITVFNLQTHQTIDLDFRMMD